MSTTRPDRRGRRARATAVAALTGTLAAGGALVALAAPAAAAPHSLRVTSAADSGAGTLREALETASTNPDVSRIVMADGLGPVTPSEPLVFSGTQPLSLVGGGATVSGSALAPLEDLLTLSGPAITVSDLTISDGPDDGLVITGASHVTIRGVTAAHNGAQGVLVDDGGADHGIVLDVRQTTFETNGVDVCDTDGMRVNEVGEGSLEATLVGVTAIGNEHDGVELDERGAGNAVATVRNSSFTGNGFNDCEPEDLEDGFDVDELDDGDVVVDIANTTSTGNAEEGLDLDEGDDELGPERQHGDLSVRLRDVDVSDNGLAAEEDNIDIDEVGDGDYVVSMVGVTSNGSGKDGYDGAEQGEGNLFVALANSSFSGSVGGRGLDLGEDGDGSFVVMGRNLTVQGNDNDGLRGEEADAGDLLVGFTDSSFTGNGGDSIQLDQGDAGTGLLRLRHTTYDDLNLSADTVVDER